MHTRNMKNLEGLGKSIVVRGYAGSIVTRSFSLWVPAWVSVRLVMMVMELSLKLIYSIDYRIDKDQQRRLVFQQGEGECASFEY